MPSRLRLRDIRLSSGIPKLGICAGDINAVADLVNRAQERLNNCRENGESGWWGSWGRFRFNVNRSDGFLTAPRQIARIESLSVCQHPTPIQNEFFEELQFGAGPQSFGSPCPQSLGVYDRNFVPTFSDIVPTGKSVRILSAAVDAGRRVLVQGTDASGATIRSQDGLQDVTGIYLVLGAPFVQAPFEISTITGIQKDVSVEPVTVYEVDLTSGDLRSLVVLEPSEEVSSYRRYFVASLPNGCCNVPGAAPETVQIYAIARLELIPARVDTDYLLLTSTEAILAECQAVRFGDMDNAEAQQLGLLKHQQAVRYLSGQLVQYLGKKPALSYMPDLGNSLRRDRVGSLV